MIEKRISIFRRREAVLPTIVLLFLLIVSTASLIFGWQLGMAVLSALRFLSWLVRGLLVLAALLGLGVIPGRLLGWGGSETSHIRRIALHFVMGWALLCLFGIVALATGVYTELIWIPLFSIGLGISAIVGTRRLRRVLVEGIHLSSGFDLHALPALLLVSSLIFGAIWMASVPPDTRDELGYHLLAPQQWALSGSWDQAPGNPRLLFPANTEILFGWASVAGGNGGPRFLALCAALLCLGLLIEGRSSTFARLMTLAFVILTPMAVLAMSVAYVEFFLSLLILLGWRLIFDDPDPRPGPAGLAWGMALGVKYTAIPIIGLLLLESLWKLGRQRRKEQRLLLIGFLGASLLLAAPWYLRNLELRGDPLYPFGTLKTAPETPDAREAAVMTSFSPIPPKWRFSPWLYHATENPLADEHLHPLWALLIPGIIFFGWRRRELPWFSIAGISVFFMLARPACRVMLPGMLPACLWLPDFIDRVSIRTLSRLLWNLCLVLLAALSLPFILGQWIVVDQGESIRYLSGEISAKKYLDDSGLLTPVIQYLNNQTPPAVRVWAWGEDRTLYLRRWVRTDAPNCEPRAFNLIGEGERGLDEELRQWKIDYILVSQKKIAEDFSSCGLQGNSAAHGNADKIRSWLKSRCREIGRDGRFRLFRVIQSGARSRAPEHAASRNRSHELEQYP